jgi:hypothetical protein
LLPQAAGLSEQRIQEINMEVMLNLTQLLGIAEEVQMEGQRSSPNPNAALFAQCSHYCEVVSHPEQMPRALEIAMQTAVSRRGVSVITLPGDVALHEAVGEGPRLTAGGSGFLAVVSGSGRRARPVSESGRLRRGPAATRAATAAAAC